MNKNEIELKALNSFGICKAYVEPNSVTIKVYGVSGCLKAWLTGKETVELGNLVNGTITREIDTQNYDGILLTQSGRQMFYGKFKSSKPQPVKDEKSVLPFNDGFAWQEVTTKTFPSENLSIRYILSHKCFYNAFILHGKYYYGTCDNLMAVAIECDIKKEPHPFLHLSPYSVYKDGYMIIVTDGKNFLTYEY